MCIRDRALFTCNKRINSSDLYAAIPPVITSRIFLPSNILPSDEFIENIVISRQSSKASVPKCSLCMLHRAVIFHYRLTPLLKRTDQEKLRFHTTFLLQHRSIVNGLRRLVYKKFCTSRAFFSKKRRIFVNAAASI